MSDRPQVNGHLLRTVKPLEGEDVRSVAMRYAALKRLTVARLLRSGLAMDKGHLTSLPLKRDRIEVFADLAGLDADALHLHTLGHLFGCPAGEGMVVPHWRRIAPGMLRADPEPWVRAHWQLACLPCDPDTGECLMHICPGCRHTLTWSRAESIHRCQLCEFDLRGVEPRRAAEPIRERAHLMAGIVRRRPDALAKLPRPIAKASLEEQVAFFGYLGTLRSLAAGIIQRPSGFVAFRGLELALSYPASFRDLVRDLVDEHGERDERLGRLVAGMAIRAQTRLLPRGKLRTRISDYLKQSLEEDYIRWLSILEVKDHSGEATLRVDHAKFLRAHPATLGRGRPLSGLGDRPIRSAS